MAEAKKAKTMRVTPRGLGPTAHLTFTTGRCRMGSSIEVSTDEGEAAIEMGLAEVASEEQLDFVDEPRANLTRARINIEKDAADA